MLAEKKRNTNIGICVGFLFQIAARLLAHEGSLIGALLGFVGVVFFVWGCFNYAQGKGYAKWWGLLGLLSLIGLIVLVIMPDKCKKS